MTEKHRWFDVDVLGVSQATEGDFLIGFRLLEDLFLVEEQIVRVVVLA